RADLLRLAAITNDVIDGNKPVDPAPGVLQPVCIGLPNANERLVVDVVVRSDIDKRRALKDTERRFQGALAGALPLGLALVHARRHEHLLEGSEVANDIAAVVQLSEAAKRRAQQSFNGFVAELPSPHPAP